MGADDQDKPTRRSSAELSVDDILGPGFAEKLSGTGSPAPPPSDGAPAEADEGEGDIAVPSMDELTDDSPAQVPDVFDDNEPPVGFDAMADGGIGAPPAPDDDPIPSMDELTDDGTFAAAEELAGAAGTNAGAVPESVTEDASVVPPPPPSTPAPLGVPLPPGMGGATSTGAIPSTPQASVLPPPDPIPYDAHEATTDAGVGPWTPPAPPTPLPDAADTIADDVLQAAAVASADDGPCEGGAEDGAPGGKAAAAAAVPTGAPLPGAAMTGRISPPRERTSPLPSFTAAPATEPVSNVPQWSPTPQGQVPGGGFPGADDAVAISDAEHAPPPPPTALAVASGTMGQQPFPPIPDDAVVVPVSEHAPAPPAFAVEAASAAMGDIPAPPIPDDAVEIGVEHHAPPPPPEAVAVAGSSLASLPSAPGPEGTPWADDVAAPMQVDTSDIQRLSTSELEDLALPGKVPKFPTGTVRRAVREVRSWLVALPMLHKVTAGVLGVALLGILLLLSSGGYPYEGWVTGELVIRAGPNDNAFPEVATLERNDPVTVLDEAGGSVLVRDHLGRVGWLPFSGVAREPAVVTAENPFTRCKQRVTEVGTEACEARADQQAASCKESCESSTNPQCASLCDKRTSDCRATCTEPAAAPDEPAATETPAVDLFSGVKDSEGAAGDGGTEASTDEPDAKASPKKKKKKRRKKRRRK